MVDIYSPVLLESQFTFSTSTLGIALATWSAKVMSTESDALIGSTMIQASLVVTWAEVLTSMICNCKERQQWGIRIKTSIRGQFHSQVSAMCRGNRMKFLLLAATTMFGTLVKTSTIAKRQACSCPRSTFFHLAKSSLVVWVKKAVLVQFKYGDSIHLRKLLRYKHMERKLKGWDWVMTTTGCSQQGTMAVYLCMKLKIEIQKASNRAVREKLVTPWHSQRKY